MHDDELHQNRKKFLNFIKTLFYTSVVIIAFSIIMATKVFNVIQVSGDSMEPNIHSGDLLISTKLLGYKKGDIIAFYYNNNILIKRVIATGGDNVYVNDEGKIYINSKELQEDYVQNLVLRKLQHYISL